MLITPRPHGLSLGISDAPRSEGLHMSDLYTDFYKALDGESEGWPEEPLAIAAEGGFQFERTVEASYQRQGLAVWRPEERLMRGGLTADEIARTGGIRYSPDLFMVLDSDDGRLRIGEIKRKWMSIKDFPTRESRRFPEKIAKHVTQMKVYCHCEATTLASFIAEFVLGNYQRPYMPVILAYDIEFTERECAEEYDMLVRHGRRRGLI